MLNVSELRKANLEDDASKFCKTSIVRFMYHGKQALYSYSIRVCSIHMMYERVIFQAISAAAKHSSVKEINDRKGYLAFKHRHGEQMHKVFDPLRGGTT